MRINARINMMPTGANDMRVDDNDVIHLENQNELEKAIRVMKKILLKSGRMEEVRRRQSFEKKSDKLRRKKKEMKHNANRKKRHEQ